MVLFGVVRVTRIGVVWRCQGNEKLATARSVKSATERQRQLDEALSLYKQITAQLDLPVVCNQFAQARFFRGKS